LCGYLAPETAYKRQAAAGQGRKGLKERDVSWGNSCTSRGYRASGVCL
jgi:hypothetical protein